MASTHIERELARWAESRRLRARAVGAGQVSGGGTLTSATAKRVFGGGAGARTALRMRAKGAPQVVVKVTNTDGSALQPKKGGEIGRSIASIRAHLEYLLKDKDPAEKEIRAAVETEDGLLLENIEDINEALEVWERGGSDVIPKMHTSKGELAEGERRARKVATNLVLSMPEGTDPEAVRAAGRAFAQESFDGHGWFLAFHQDKDHPHVHIMVRNLSIDGSRLIRSNREQLHEWRQSFAAQLIVHGVAARAEYRTGRHDARSYMHKAYYAKLPDPAPEWMRGRDEVGNPVRGAWEMDDSDTMAALRRQRLRELQRVTQALALSDLEDDRRLADELYSADPELADSFERERRRIGGAEGFDPQRITGPYQRHLLETRRGLTGRIPASVRALSDGDMGIPRNLEKTPVLVHDDGAVLMDGRRPRGPHH